MQCNDSNHVKLVIEQGGVISELFIRVSDSPSASRLSMEIWGSWAAWNCWWNFETLKSPQKVNCHRPGTCSWPPTPVDFLLFYIMQKLNIISPATCSWSPAPVDWEGCSGEGNRILAGVLHTNKLKRLNLAENNNIVLEHKNKKITLCGSGLIVLKTSGVPGPIPPNIIIIRKNSETCNQ